MLKMGKFYDIKFYLKGVCRKTTYQSSNQRLLLTF